MAATTTTITNGSDLMVFAQMDTALKSIACATSHQLQISVNTRDVSTKDNGNGVWQALEAGLASWTLQTDNLVTDGKINGLSIDDLIELQMKREPFPVCFATQGNMPDVTNKLDAEFVVPEGGWTPDTKNRYYGNAIITSLQVTAQNGEKATATATFTGCGALRRMGKGMMVATVSGGASQPVAPVAATSAETAKK